MPSAKKIVGNVANLVKTDSELALEQSQKVIEEQKIDIEKLDKALKLYESENLLLREELEHATRIISANSTKIGENERTKQKLKHQVASGEKKLRFEKVMTFILMGGIRPRGE
jgi:septal ring factor EnvC (AmiA/AmiB activator)